MKLIKEDYLDAEQQFWDFHTKPVTDEIVFDTSTTGVSDYNDFFRNPTYMRDKKNLVYTIEYMTPMEYFEGCAKIFKSDVNNEILAIKADKKIVQHLMDVLTVYKKTFPLGYLNFAEREQEGRHRMYVAGEYSGWNVKQPVMVVNWHDAELAKRQKEEEKFRTELRHISNAIYKTLPYTFTSMEDFEYQLQCELNREYGVSYNEPDIEFTLERDEDKEQFVVRCGVAYDTIDYNSVKIEEPAEDAEDDFDLDAYLANAELDLDELDEIDVDEWLKKRLGECFTRNILKESIEKHDTLNPLIWDGEYLRTDVRVAILEVVNKYVEDSEVLTLDDVIDIELLGSNASYNYTKDSDLDVHLVVNMEILSSDPALVQIACNAEKALFNKAYNITIKGIDIELYVEDVKTGAVSNGVFSVSKNEWLKRPVPKDIPDFKDDEEYLGLLDAWMIKAKKACSSKSRAEVNAFINDLYNLRRISIMTDGEYALGNLVFKEIRNHGLLQELKDLQNVLASKELSLEGLQ
jgi:hypothetical protein